MAYRSVGNEEGLVETMTQYLFAPDTADQVNAGVVITPPDPFEGLMRTAAARTEGVEV